MKRTLALFVLVAVWLAFPGAQRPQEPSAVPDEVLVKFRPQATESRRDLALARRNARVLRRFDAIDLYHVGLPRGANLQAELNALQADPDVELVQPNYIRRTTATAPPNDPFWLDGTLWGLQKIQAQNVWSSYTTGDGTVVVADIDTGVNYLHPDLAANMWTNPGEIPGNGIDDDSDGYVDDVHGINVITHSGDPMDDHGHGTHTSGTMAAVGNNSTGVVGVNWNAKILACKFLNSGGSGSDAGAIECFNYIVMLKQRGVNVRVSNNSWGSTRSGGIPTGLKAAIDAAGTAGILNAFAAGNAGTNNDTAPFDPASLPSPSILSVAASDQIDDRASFSNYGASVHLAAPGVSITSTYVMNYGSLSGTSMAVPHAAGAAALLALLEPTLSPEGIKAALMNNVDVLSQWSGLVSSGGRLNVYRAAGAVQTQATRTNVALAANGGTAVASSTYGPGYSPATVINGDRTGSPWGNGGGWMTAARGFPNWVEVDFAGAQTINEIDVIGVQDNYSAPSEPTSTLTFTRYGVTSFEAQYWTGSAWQAVPGGQVTGNTLVWRQLLFGALTTARIRIYLTQSPDSYGQLVEVEAYTVGSGSNVPPTVALTGPANGATFSAPATIGVSATAGDTDGTIASVQFFANGAPIGTDTTSPYGVTWSNVAAGTYALTAVATDNGGASTASAAITMTVTPGGGGTRTNVALAANGGTALASSSYGGVSGYGPSGVTNGDRKGHPWGPGNGWMSAAAGFPAWVEVDFAGAQTIDEINVFSVQDNWGAPSDPTLTMTFTRYGVADFEVQYWTGTAWTPVPGGQVVNNNKVWRQFVFGAITTARIRVYITRSPDSYAQLTEVEAYTAGSGNVPPTVALTSPANGATFSAPATVGVSANAGDIDGTITSVQFFANGASIGTDTTSPYGVTWSTVAAGTYSLTAVATDNGGASTTSAAITVTVTPGGGGTRTNVALAANGGTAVASSTYGPGYSPATVINGDRTGSPWGNGGGWMTAARGFPNWVEVDFAGAQTINEIDVIGVQDNYSAPSEPTSTLTFTRYGVSSFEAQYWTGSAWQAVPGGQVTGNNLVWRQLLFGAITTPRIRIYLTQSPDSYGQLVEVEAYTAGSAPLAPPVVQPSALNVRVDLVGQIASHTNPTSPAVAGSQLLLPDQAGFIYRWDGTQLHDLLTPSTFPPGILPPGGESVLNVGANQAGSLVYVMFSTFNQPTGIPVSVSPRPNDSWQVLYEYSFNGTQLSNPRAIRAFQVRSDAHTGGGLAVLADGTVLVAMGDNGDAGEDGRTFAQDPANHLSKILRVTPSNGSTTVVAMGIRNVQRLAMYGSGPAARLDFADLGGSIAEELNSILVSDLLAGPVHNFGWGLHADGNAREGTFYIDFGGAVVGAAPVPESGFRQPVGQFGREGATLIAVSGPVSSPQSFSGISSLFGDLVSGSVYAVTGALTQFGQPVFRVNLFDSQAQPVTLEALAGGRPDVRFFNFPDGTAGVLLERTGRFYRLTQTQ